ncbi:MAG: hypothetical protein JW757_13025 [Anaerolineales bacterium]|nr:hypothetical protein [Anaerolineales bacterium]
MDSERKVFHPPRRRGLAVNLGLSLALGLVTLALLILASQNELGPAFLGMLLGALLVAVPIPILTNRAFALIRSHYMVERDGIRLKWGFREVDIPITEIEYVELAEDLLIPLEYPRVQWPGAVTGVTQQDKLGMVEFLSAERRGMVMIGTPGHVFVISPEHPKALILHYRQVTELGSLSPLPAYSTSPSFLLVDIWRIPRLRILLVATTVLSLALLGLVAWAVPDLTEVSLGFDATGKPLPPVSPGQLFLLPILNIFLLAASYLLSMLFFRQQADHPLVSVLWFGNAITSMLFLIATLFILQTG